MGYLLEMQDVSKSFGEVKSLRGVDFHASHGEVVGLLGDNGAGKSTMIKIMTGYISRTPANSTTMERRSKI